MDLEATVIYEWLEGLSDEKKLIVLEGSTRSSKTVSLEMHFMTRLLRKPNHVVRCFRQTSALNDRTTIQDWEEVCDMFGNPGTWKISAKEYHLPNGSKICFNGTEKSEDLKGLKQDDAWMEEVTEHSKKAYDQISYRTTGRMYFSFNPSHSHHWIFSDIIDSTGERIIKKRAYNHSTYKDNPFLSDDQIFAIEKMEPTAENITAGTSDQWGWDVYGLGKRGALQGRIFPVHMIRPTTIWPDLKICEAHGLGLDFGSVHPTALVDVRLYNGEIYLKSLIYESDLISTPNPVDPTHKSIAALMDDLKVDKTRVIVCDNSRPEIITDLQLYGYRAIPCVKGGGSVNEGINLMKQFIINIWHEDKNSDREFSIYRWRETRQGIWVDEPVKADDDIIDATRYFITSRLTHYASLSVHQMKNGMRSNKQSMVGTQYEW